MKSVIAVTIAVLSQSFITAAEWNDGLRAFIEESCAGCHDADTDTRLDLTSLGYDLEGVLKFIFVHWRAAWT